jgi:hypothetical protein
VPAQARIPTSEADIAAGGEIALLAAMETPSSPAPVRAPALASPHAPLLRSITRTVSTSSGSSAVARLARIAAALEAVFNVDHAVTVAAGVDVTGGVPIVALRDRLPPADVDGIADEVLQTDVVEAVGKHPSCFYGLAADGKRLVQFRPLERITRVVDSLFSEEPPVSAAERDVVGAWFEDAIARSGARASALLRDLLAVSGTLRSITPGGLTLLQQALRTHPPTFVALSTTAGNAIRRVGFAEGVARVVDGLFSKRAVAANG